MPLVRWWRDLSRRRDARTVQRRAIPDLLWQLTLARFPFLAARSAEDQAGLRTLATLFLARKEFTGAQGFVVTDEIAVAVAAQACLPILRLGLDAYDAFVGIVIHGDEVVARREVMDDDGIVHHYDETLAGEAMEGGPVMLSWRDVEDAGESASWGYNVVVHEFAHVLDMRDGAADGVPLLSDRDARERWVRVIDAAYEAFAKRIDAGEETLLDPYGAESVDEFFAVSSEHFFVAPHDLIDEAPEMYELLARYYRQDPASQLQA